jgi:hypothetical protein
MSFIKNNQNKLWAIIASVVFHLLVLLFMMLENKQQAPEPDKLSPELLLQLEELIDVLDSPTPVLADKSGEKEVSTNLNNEPEPPKLEEEEEEPLPEKLMTAQKIDSVGVTNTAALIASLIPSNPPTIVDTLPTDLKQIIKKTDSVKTKRALFVVDQEFIKKNYKTIYNLRKVFAFAKKARDLKERLDLELHSIKNPSERRKAIKMMEKEVWQTFEKEARTMTTSQGKLLLKLVSRETGQTGYTIVKEYKGAIPAIFWQGVAKMFSQNLKSQYDSIGEDALLETIVKKYERKEIK